MDTYELKKEQARLASKIQLQDGFSPLKTISGAACIASGNKLIGCIVICEFPSLTLIEEKTYVLSDPLPYQAGFVAYREMPALLEAYNLLDQEPDVLLVEGEGILHPRRLGLASHMGLILNHPTIGISDVLSCGRVEEGKIYLGTELRGFEVLTREHAKPLYLSPGHLITLGSALNIIRKTIQYPHKMPEPLHLAHKLARKRMQSITVQGTMEKGDTQNRSVVVEDPS